MTKRIPWWQPQITPVEYKLVKKVLDSNYINEGDVTTEFEQRIASLLKVKYTIAASSGTAGLFLALAAVGIGGGDEVLVPDVTFIASANAVSLTGATPILIDVNPKTLTVSLQAIKKTINKHTKAIMPVHISGRSADMDSILQIAKEYNLFVIEDAAEGFMSAGNGKYLGTLGDLGCLSFSANKTITTGQGGMVLTNSYDLAIKVRKLKDQGRPMRGTGGDDIHDSVGYNFKLTNLQAAIGLGQLTALKKRLVRQKRIYELYKQELDGITGIRLLGFDLKAGEVPLWTDALVDRRDELVNYLLKHNIHCRKFWFPIHTQIPYKKVDRYFPHTTSVIPHAVWLPSAFTLTNNDIHNVCSLIREFLLS